MDGSNDVRPEPPRRASDPSLEDMLRRARDAHLGGESDTPPPNTAFHRFLRPSAPYGGDGPGSGGWTLFLSGVIIGILLCYGIIQASTNSPSLPPQTVTQSTATAQPTTTPTATETPIPTASPELYLPPPTSAEIVALVQNYYDNYGPFAGTYVLVDVTTLQIDSSDEHQLTVCIAYDAATVTAPDTVVGSNTRLFTLLAAPEGSWQVVQMGGSNSCRPT